MGKSYKKILEDRNFLYKKELSNGIIIFTIPGKKSDKDFRVRAYNKNTFQGIQPKHAHFAIDFYGKLCYNKDKTKKLLEAIVDIWNNEDPEETIKKYASYVKDLPGYDIEYILNCLKLILDQEDINFSSRSEEKQKELDNIISSTISKIPKNRLGSQLAIALLCYIFKGVHPVEAFIKCGLRI
jgi:hypothetical protein